MSKPFLADSRTREKASRAGLKARMLTDGVWRKFLARREYLRGEGLTPAEAHRIAAKEFPPESMDSLVVEEIFEAGGLGDEEAEACRSEDLADPNGANDAAGASGSGEGADGESPPPLLKAADFEEKDHVSFLEQVEWVFDHIEISDVKPKDAPSAGAWGWLQLVRNNPAVKQGFYNQIVAKLIPSKAQMEMENRFRDDGRKIIALIERVKAASVSAVLSVRSEGLLGESRIPNAAS